MSQYLIVAGVAFFASVLGGVAGYGTGLLLPPVLIPIIGAEAVVPVVSLSALLTNASRIWVYWNSLDRSKVKTIMLFSAPSCILGAYGYTLLSGPLVSVLIGTMLVLIVPIRGYLLRRHGYIGGRSLVAAATGYGVLVGGTSGSGAVLISILLSTGLSGVAVIATDAGISLLLGALKVVIFQSAGVLPPALWIMAMVIGIAAIPGTLLAKRLTGWLSGNTHVLLLNGVVMLGGALLIVEGTKGLIP